MKGNPPDILEAIRHVLSGEVYLSDQVRQWIAEGRELSDGQEE